MTPASGSTPAAQSSTTPGWSPAARLRLEGTEDAAHPPSTVVLPAVTTMVGLLGEWTEGLSGRTALSSIRPAGLSGGAQQKLGRWRRLVGVVNELSKQDSGQGDQRRQRRASEVAETVDRALKRRKIGLRKLVDIIAKPDTKEEFLAELDWQ